MMGCLQFCSEFGVYILERVSRDRDPQTATSTWLDAGCIYR